MRVQMKLKEFFKRTMAMTVAVCMIMFQLTSDVTFASMEIEANEYTAIITEKLGKYGRVFTINGQIKENGNLPDMHQGIISMLSDETVVYDNSFAANQTDYANDNSIYTKSTAGFNCNTIALSDVIVAERDIAVNASAFTSEEYTIIYSKNGSININVAEMNFKGLLYAPNGSITINGSNINIDGTMVAKGVNLYIDTFTINAGQFSESMVNVLNTFRNDRLLTLTGYTYEDDIIVGFESDADYERIDIYIRNDNATEFTYLTSTTETEYTISEYTFEQYMDIMAVARTAYGDSYDSTLMTVGYSNDEYAEKLASYANDGDEDGIMDGIEVWYGKTNPNNADSDGDGFNDYVECFYLCTDPNVANDDGDSDGDGINDGDEVTNGTHPYLKDTDFDGYTDNEDGEPLKYNGGATMDPDYTEDRVVGMFDKVNTWIDTNGNVYQYVYNFINDNVEYTMINGVITKYYYNTEDQLTAVVTINGGVMDAVTYTYNGEVLSSVAYNGLLYEFATTETTENITIAGNTYRDVVYGENEQVITYGSGYEVRNTFNEQGDATAIYYNGEIAFECEYDENGQPVRITDHKTGYEQSYTYLEDGNIDTITGNDYTMAYQYSDEEYVIDYDINGEKYSQIIYNDTEDKYSSQYSSLLVSGGLHENIETEEGDIEYKITENGNVVFSNLLTYDGSTVTDIAYNNGDKYTYEYTNEGKISNVLQNGDKVITYTYDNLGRVVREDNALSGKSYEFIYNADNNMEVKRTYSYSTGEFTEMLSEETFAYENVWKDQLTDISGTKITYDEVGNAISYRGGMTFEWSGKTLTGVNGSVDIDFTYNHEGIRTSKTVDGVKTEYIIEGKDIVFEVSENGVTAYIYDSDMNVIGMMCDGSTYYFEKNVQGDVVRILDEAGNVLCEYVYDAWGNVVLVEGNSELAKKNPFRYRGYYYDVETGLYYAESRYYDPQTGRFISADKIEAIVWDYTNLNMYVYCGNDPVNMYDPSGEAPIYVKYMVSKEIYSDVEYGSSEYVESFGRWIGTLAKGGSVSTYVIDNEKEFVNIWNGIVSATAVVIDSHAGPDGLQFLNENGEKESSAYPGLKLDGILRNNEMEELLYRRSIKFVWILGCNAGHYDSQNNNVASVLAKKINGVVVASDGTVCNKHVKVSGVRTIASYSYGDAEWKRYAAYRTTALGWIVYRYNTQIPKIEKVVMNSTILSIFSVSDYLVNNNYVSYK